MTKTPVGGHKCRAWRLKKKRHRYFLNKVIREIVAVTLENLPIGMFGAAYSHGYAIMRLFRHD